MGAEFTIEGTAFDTLGYDATYGQVLDLALEDATGLDAPRVVYSVVATSDGAPAVTLSPSTGIPTTPTGTVTATMPGSGTHSYRIQCQINSGRDSTGRTNRAYTKERLVALRSTELELRKLVPGETTQYSSTGWTEEQNRSVDAIETSIAAIGGVGDVEATADTLALRGSGAQLKAAWAEIGIGTGPTTGSIRLNQNASAYGYYAGNNLRAFEFSTDDLQIGSHLTDVIVYTKANGSIIFRHDDPATTFFRIMATGPCSASGQVRVSTDGRLRVYVTADAAERTLITSHDVTFEATDKKLAADSLAADVTLLTSFSGPLQRAVEIVAAHFVPAAALTANDTDYAQIDVFAIDGAGAATAYRGSTTRTDGTGNWTAFIPVPLANTNAAPVAAGSHFAYQIIKQGAGVIVPAGVLSVSYRYVVP